MKLSVKSDYAARAVLGLARHYQSGRAVRVEELGREQGIPPNFLVQILLELKSAKLVLSRRGKEGGYLLALPPARITMGDVLRCIYGQILDTPALADDHCPPELRDAWRRLRDSLETTADQINFPKLLEAGTDKARMYYI